MRILLDAGHGGTAPGAVNRDLEIEEADFNLQITLALGEELYMRGHCVTHTRMDDRTLSPSARLKMIQLARPDCFISIHNDWAGNPTVSGFSIVYKDEYDKPLADSVLSALADSLDLKNRGLLRDGSPMYNRQLAVLKDIETPAILVECGFISNEDDVAYLKDNIQLLVKAIADGVEDWD